MGRRRRECCFAKGVGCPILASLFERAEGWLQVGSNVNRVGDAPTHARRAWGRHRERLSSAQRHRLAARKISDLRLCLRASPGSGTSHRRSSRCRSFVAVNAHHVGVSCLSPPKVSRTMFRCSGSSHRAGINDAPAARSTPGSRFALCLSWFVLAHPARPSLLRRCGRTTEISVRRRVRPAKKESLHAPPKAVFTRLRRPLIAGEARESS